MERKKFIERILFISCLMVCACSLGIYWDEIKLWTLILTIIGGPTVFWIVCLSLQENKKKNIVSEGYLPYVAGYALITATFLLLAQNLKIPRLWIIWLLSLTGFWWPPISINFFEEFFLGEHAMKDE